MSPRVVPRTILILGALATAQASAAPNIELGITSESTPALSVTFDTLLGLFPRYPAIDLRLATGLLWLPGDHYQDNLAWRLTPALRYGFADGRAYVEAGVGGALFVETRLEERDLSTAFQFEDRLAAGIRLGRESELGISASHYSNAGLDLPNDGFEVYSLSYRLAL
ncbi:acyloxyacyl hydrolase [Halomonas organivorans]|uniref:Lipid A 3-O-deacylase n=1 Tax=Halomonas organivorans TaxID=257772 RepID=A0A7W5BZ50_9GAMM|nr:acyloxyacyl hydrolase [Halomonas organivorans]MBB3141697.1 lipid A 3-O-deacylase [Halomonas organivorans]